MKTWKIAICDDEKTALILLKGAIKSVFDERKKDVLIETFEQPDKLLARMKEQAFDLLFLDIEMPKINGLQVAQRLRKEGNLIDIIYISNREDQVFNALRMNPRGFIRKGKLIQDVSGVIDSYLSMKKEDERENATLLVKDQSQVRFIPLDKILYIEGSGKEQYATLVGGEAPTALHRSMQELEEELTPKGFMRIHKGYLVNYLFVRLIGDKDVTLTDGTNLPISRRKYQEIRERYMELMQGESPLML